MRFVRSPMAQNTFQKRKGKLPITPRPSKYEYGTEFLEVDPSRFSILIDNMGFRRVFGIHKVFLSRHGSE
ncbi:hypothetical protein WG66_014556 [Moniliophthora roreri]|nr:hypothetical protein WG66_014556 [Moniliophthora roreri]